jgi:predicted nucleotidyltransferase
MLNDVLNTLKANEDVLRKRGVIHAAVFGSTASGMQTKGSDVDILIDLDESKPINVFDYAAIKDEIKAIVGGRADVVTREGLKKALRERVEQEAVDAF